MVMYGSGPVHTCIQCFGAIKKDTASRLI
jgi:hypothetical protein